MHDDAQLAVVAHGLLNALSAVVGCVSTVRYDLGEDYPLRHLLDKAQGQAWTAAEVLRDMARGLPPAAIDALDDLLRHVPG